MTYKVQTRQQHYNKENPKLKSLEEFSNRKDAKRYSTFTGNSKDLKHFSYK